jgi:hypothetical protein
MASTKPNQLITYDCFTDAADDKCEEKVEAQRRIIEEAGITLAESEKSPY